MNLKNEIRNFIDNNRQMYNTTICVDAALKHNAYFIVLNLQEKQKLMKFYPKLKCYTLPDIEFGRIRGLDRAAVIFDPYVVRQLCFNSQDKVEKDGVIIDNDGDITITNKNGVSFNTKCNLNLTVETNQPLNNQVNVKLSDDQLNSVKELNNEIFEGTASLSNMVRLLIVKGLKYYKEMI
jgi:hypothetical protein